MCMAKVGCMRMMSCMTMGLSVVVRAWYISNMVHLYGWLGHVWLGYVFGGRLIYRGYDSWLDVALHAWMASGLG